MTRLSDMLSPEAQNSLRIERMVARSRELQLATRWTPQHRQGCSQVPEECTCPQVLAYRSTADIVGYGGAAGGGKSDLLLGKAGTKHKRAIIFRRVFPSLRGMIDRSREIYNAAGVTHLKDSFNEGLHIWRLSDERMIEFGSLQHEKDLKKYQGQPHDFIGVDEATEFPERYVRFLMGWLRTTIIGQSKQVVLTFNPPMDDSGNWVVRFFAPWLDPKHPKPAKDGELRWYAMIQGKEEEVPGPEPVYIPETKETVKPKSRTFFHASLRDNPALLDTDYGSQIDALPEPLRSLLKGNFAAGRIVNPWQVIPTEWVQAAMDRWTARGKDTPPEDEDLTAVAMDPARGGGDSCCIARLWGWWFAPIEQWPGSAVPDGPTAAGLLTQELTDGTPVAIDVIGIGASVYDSCAAQEGATVTAHNNAGKTGLRDKSGKLKFANVRAASYWVLREALDPKSETPIALPPDAELKQELCAPTYRVTTSGILLEPKEDIHERIGRSPDKADAVVMAHWLIVGEQVQVYI